MKPVAPVPAIAVTTALESTPPDRNAPSGTSEIRRSRTDSSRRCDNSDVASSTPILRSSVNCGFQYSTGSETAAPRRTVSVCPGGSFFAPVKIVRGSGT